MIIWTVRFFGLIQLTVLFLSVKSNAVKGKLSLFKARPFVNVFHDYVRELIPQETEVHDR